MTRASSGARLSKVSTTTTSDNALLAAIACAALLAVVAALPSGAAAASACKPKYSKTIASGGTIRVFRPTRAIRSPQGKRYTKRDSVVCNSKNRKWFRIYADRDLGPDPVRINGRYVAAGLPQAAKADGDEFLGLKVVILDTGTGQQLARANPVSPDGGVGWEIVRMDLTRTGVLSLAFRGPWYSPGMADNFIIVMRDRKATVIDRGPSVDLASMRREGTTLSWLNGGAEKTTPVD